jgi:hypothetical protein
MLAFLLIGAAKILLFLGSIAQMVSRAPTAVIESCFWRLSSALRRHRRSFLIGETAQGSRVPTFPIGPRGPERDRRGQRKPFEREESLLNREI